ncbi:MAG: nucleotide exchange factor GrpE [Ruminococcus sp.]|nr:nucleotide exchange factor GrpE [Ruminococcus sp.]
MIKTVINKESEAIPVAETNEEKDLEETKETQEETQDTPADQDVTEEAEQKKEDEAPEQTEEEKLRAELEAANDKYLRLMAEYDNFRKRSAKERLELSNSVKGDTVGEILPLFDNFERALAAETEDLAYKQGVEMIFKQFGDMLTKLGVKAMDLVGKEFDPNTAMAVSSIEDDELGENVVAQVLQNGYTLGDKVIRHAMVVVANP